jgi:cell division topological specificity factor
MSFFRRFSSGKKKSAKSAKERLQLVLTHDRTDITPAQLDALKDELIEVISRHIEIDPDAVNIDVAREGREQRLIADIPLKAKARQRGR